MPVGVVANNPAANGGVLFVDSADKAARFIWMCDAYNIPLVYLADVPGFMVGKQVERQGIIRAGAKMIMAVSYGDQLTNMLQPFWALPLLGITGCRARDIVGYTAVVMVFRPVDRRSIMN